MRALRIQGLPAQDFLRELYKCIDEDNVFNGAAALAFYLTLAVFPALIALMSVIPYLPIEEVDEAIMDLIGQALPEQSAAMVENVVDEVTQEQRGGLLSLGLLATLWAASTGMYAVMRQLNITYDVEEARSFVRARTTAILLSLLFGGLVLGAFSLVVVGGVLEEWMGEVLGYSGALVAAFAVFRWIVICLSLLAGLALIFRFAPNVRQRLRFILPGSLFGTAVLILASLAFSSYIANFADYSATYGSIGAVIVLMLWLYVAGLVILVGSEINALLEHLSSQGKRKKERTPSEDGAEGPETPRGRSRRR